MSGVQNDFFPSLYFEGKSIMPSEQVCPSFLIHTNPSTDQHPQTPRSQSPSDLDVEMQPVHEIIPPNPASPEQQTYPTDPVLGLINGPPQPHLPSYIRRPPSRITPQDLTYLAHKDALYIPDDEFRIELLRTYVDVFHPFIPVLDLESFLAPILGSPGHKPVSLLLFQAVMFVSVAFVDAKFLRARGYRDRKSARKAFFNRVRLLYGLDCEPDRLSLLQSLILMTFWYDSPDDEKDTWHWMGTALSLAQVLGFHRNPSLLKLKSQERKLRSRIWWSCFMRDRQLALGLRRPPRIRGDETDVPQLTLDDFNLAAPSPEVASRLGPSSFTDPDPEARKVLAMLCIDLSKLCLCIGHIVYSQYTALSNCPIGSENLLKVLVAPRAELQEETLVSCDAELDQWLQSQDPLCKYAAPSPSGDNESVSKRVVRLHQAILHMFYLSTVAILHRPHIFRSESAAGEGKISPRVSKEKVTKAAVAATELAYDLQRSNLVRYLPPGGIPTFLSAALIHLFDIRSQDENVRNVSIGRFYQCVQALQQLQDMYASADYAVKFLGNIQKRTAVNIPGLGFMFPSALAGKRPQRSTAPACSSLCQHSPGRIDTAYPSPSSTRNHQPSLQVPHGGEDGLHVDLAMSTAMHQQPEPWVGQGVAMHGQQDDEAMTDLPQVSMWSDVDSLLTALFNFDGDANVNFGGEANMFMSNSGPAMSADWSFSGLDLTQHDDYSRG